MHCNQCGLEVPDNYKFCPKCGAEIMLTNKPALAKGERRHTKSRYLLPIVLGIIGGLIAYFWVRNEDPKLARNCLILGFIISLIGIAFSVWIKSLN